jgi:cytochrome P450
LEERKKSGRGEKGITEAVLNWMDKLDSPEFKELNITESTLLTQALVVFFAGQDNLAAILTNVFLEVGKNPAIEDKIFKELDAFLKKHNGQIEYEDLQELVYLKACIQESSRFRIKKGMVVMIPIFTINRHPKYFPNGDTFDPERFLPENKDKIYPYTFMTFGYGPKNCMGMRYSYDVMLLVAAFLYRDFHFRCDKDTKLEFTPGKLFLSSTRPMKFNILNRN